MFDPKFGRRSSIAESQKATMPFLSSSRLNSVSGLALATGDYRHKARKTPAASAVPLTEASFNRWCNGNRSGCQLEA